MARIALPFIFSVPTCLPKREIQRDKHLASTKHNSKKQKNSIFWRQFLQDFPTNKEKNYIFTLMKKNIPHSAASRSKG
ncbi:hypothetical protein [Microbulbifer agarilyticus]|uniref:hypothetical protein n=1 Tax=Microbulbifer agarilyticus TaxID=260552 RepID=UPI001CD36331|nr:hypothetical protein [Microbulbifer agarilyticus]MCA0901849.1 hypothetical protein [Microbulbifer agarilyticus]